MNSRMPDEVELKTQSGYQLLPKDRTILEREFMEFRPFGLDEKGHTIRDLSGMSIKAVVVYLEKSQSLAGGVSAGTQAVEKLCQLLNQRMKDPCLSRDPEAVEECVE